MDVSWMVKSACLLIVLIGHGAGWVACFNRINATGLQRHVIKVIEKSFILFCLFIPVLVGLTCYAPLYRWLIDPLYGLPELPSYALSYFGLCMVSFILLAPDWIVQRYPLLTRSPFVVRQVDHRWNVAQHVPGPLFTTGESRLLGRLSFNEIGQLELSEKHLFIPELPADWMGLRIGHVSDVHLTGHMSPEYPRFALNRLMEHRPDLVILTGDILDYEHQLSHIESVFGGVTAPLGKFFILGNHDRRLPDPNEIRKRFQGIGWVDVSKRAVTIRDGHRTLKILGNESPWFGPRKESWGEEGTDESFSKDELRIAVSHAPDQWPWAARLHAHLFLAGHTHGGQVRVPGLGPLIAPSWYGSRFASGVFMQQELLMHVSRGLSGVHLFRWNCYPEITLLVASPAEYAFHPQPVSCTPQPCLD